MPSQRAPKLLLACGFAALAWAAIVAATGGHRFELLGARVSTTDPMRPLLVALLAFGIAAWRWPGAVRAVGDAIVLAPVRHAAIATVAVAAAVFAVALLRGSTVAAGADSYGYVSEAAMWRHGQLVFPIDLIREAPWPNAAWTLSGLGFRPAAARPDAIVPTYAPGYPLLIALFQIAGGYAAGFLVVPIAAALTVWLTFALGRRLFGSPALGLWAASLVAVSPAFLMQSMSPMSDVPVAAAWTAALVLAVAGRPLASGLAMAATIAIRPNLVLLPASLVTWQVIAALNGRRHGTSGGAGRSGPPILMCAGLLPGVLLVALVDQHLYGSPLASGYGSTATLYSLGAMPTNVARYGTWLLETQTPAILLALLFFLVPRWSEPAGAPWPRLLLGGTIVATAISYVFYFPFTDWWYLRFLLPMWPALLLAFAAAVDGIWRRWTPRLRPIAVAICVVAFAWEGLGVAAARYAFDVGGGERRYVDVARFVASRTDPRAVVICMQHSGSIRQYAGRLTLRIDWLEAGALDRAAAYLASTGRHPYIVLENWEIDQFQQRFAARNRLGRLDWLPIAVLRGWNDVAVYDAADTSSHAAPVSIPAVSVARTIAWPVDPPAAGAIPFP